MERVGTNSPPTGRCDRRRAGRLIGCVYVVRRAMLESAARFWNRFRRSKRPTGGRFVGLLPGAGVGSCVIQTQEVRQHALLDFGTGLGLRMIGRQGLARSAVGPRPGP